MKLNKSKRMLYIHQELNRFTQKTKIVNNKKYIDYKNKQKNLIKNYKKIRFK